MSSPERGRKNKEQILASLCCQVRVLVVGDSGNLEVLVSCGLLYFITCFKESKPIIVEAFKNKGITGMGAARFCWGGEFGFLVSITSIRLDNYEREKGKLVISHFPHSFLSIVLIKVMRFQEQAT
ncbi:predicted protein [Arabidopsis lyrata subsp. lyrata]|uniref:Predicted protein n=1 Tax=Arabidopsis lyrata subsp. lyrata TaxID=81972 RepID=D7LE71_ARALL|nr:predicted protein [Arabidopsis lyrata subsp. lyrata]